MADKLKKTKSVIHATTLAAVLVGLASSVTTVGVVALLQRYITIEVIFGLLAPLGSILAAALGVYFGASSAIKEDENHEVSDDK